MSSEAVLRSYGGTGRNACAPGGKILRDRRYGSARLLFNFAVVWVGGYMWQASELAVAVGDAAGDAADAPGSEIRVETGTVLGCAGDVADDDAVDDADGDEVFPATEVATGRGARFAFAKAELTEGSVSELRVRQATMDLLRLPQDSSITSRAVEAGAASPDSIMKEVRARSRFTPPMPSEPLAPARISAIFTSRFFRASVASFTGGAAVSGAG